MDITKLLALQTEDGRLRDLQRELKVLLPQRRNEAKDRLQKARERVEAAVQANMAAEREVERLRGDYSRQRDAMDRAARNSAGMTSIRGLEAIQVEHASAEAAAVAVSASLDGATSALTPTERDLENARAFEAAEDVAVQEILNNIENRKAEVEAAAAAVTAEREALAAEVPEDQKRYYDRLRLIRWPCAVPYNRIDGVCTGCNLVQPPSVTQMVLHADKKADAKLVVCPSCGRILY